MAAKQVEDLDQQLKDVQKKWKEAETKLEEQSDELVRLKQKMQSVFVFMCVWTRHPVSPRRRRVIGFLKQS